MASWFGEQLEKRLRADQNDFSDALGDVSEVIIGKKMLSIIEQSEIRNTRNAINEVLKYYHVESEDWSETLNDPDEILDAVLNPVGIMRRPVQLTGDWYRHAEGTYLGYTNDGQLVALIPHHSWYEYLDHATGETVHVNRKTVKNIMPEAFCFYRPLPLRAIKVKDLLEYMARELSIYDYAAILLIALLMTLFSMGTPLITQYLFGQVIHADTYSPLISTAMVLISLSVSTALLSIGRELALGRILVKTDVSVRAAIMMRLISLPASFFRKYSTAELANRSQTINALCQTICRVFFSSAVTALFSLLYLGQIFSISPALAAPALLIVLSLTLFMMICIWLQMGLTEKELNYTALQNGMLYAYMTNIEKIKCAGAERRVFSNWLRVYQKSAMPKYNPPTLVKLKPVFITGITLLGTLLLYRTAINSSLTPADYMGFQASFALLTAAFMQMLDVAQKFALIRPILNNVKPIMDAVPERAANRKKQNVVTGGVTMSNVCFQYEDSDRMILNDLNLDIKPGQYVAIVGRSGCGKSTLVRLLLGFERPLKGAVFYDQHDLATLDLPWLRRHIGCVMQNDKLFPGSILSNISISAPTLTEEGAWKAAEMAGIAEDIRRMPMGMNTLISEGASCISGGQRQRLIIARAIASNPKILIMDEATSALDNLTQHTVAEALNKMNVTRIVIAHRLSTVRHCDRILVMNQGRIEEEGTYEELIAKNGLFSDLVKHQQL